MLEVFRSTSSKLILLLVIVLVAILQYQFWLGEGGYAADSTTSRSK